MKEISQGKVALISCGLFSGEAVVGWEGEEGRSLISIQLSQLLGVGDTHPLNGNWVGH